MNPDLPKRMYRVLDRALEKERQRIRAYDVDPPKRVAKQMVARQRRETAREIEQERNQHLAAIIALRARGVL